MAISVLTSASVWRQPLFYLFAASLIVAIGGVIVRPLLTMLIRLVEKIFGPSILPAHWRSTGAYWQELRDSSKHSSEWLSNWRNRWRGRTALGNLFAILPFFLLMVIGSMSIPLEHSIVNGQVKTDFNVCLPHVDEDMDQYHWVLAVDCVQDERLWVRAEFCPSGLKPSWNEGQTLTFIRYRVLSDCLELLGYDGKRDRLHKIINW